MNDAGKIPDTEQVADHLAIQQVLHIHSRGLDRLDPEAIKSAYWPEGEVDYGSYKGGAHPFAELVVAALQGQYELTRHCLSNTLIQFSGTGALAESNVTAAHLLHGAAQEMLFYGLYLDQLQQRNGQWRILHRQVVMDWSKTVPVCDARNSEAFAALAKGAHLDVDPLYPFLKSEL